MPSRHRRIGLVVDEDVDSALNIVRAGSRTPTRGDATIARTAVLDGAVLAALISAAGQSGGRASGVVSELRDLLPSLALPPRVVAAVVESLDAAQTEQTSEQRRHLQLALLQSPDPHGSAALDYADSFDALDAVG